MTGFQVTIRSQEFFNVGTDCNRKLHNIVTFIRQVPVLFGGNPCRVGSTSSCCYRYKNTEICDTYTKCVKTFRSHAH